MPHLNHLDAFSDKSTLLSKYKGVNINDIPTPAFIVDKTIMESNCCKMLENIQHLNHHVKFRAHVKAHKTVEGTKLQLQNGLVKRVIVSTVVEGYMCLELVKLGIVNDILYGLPPYKNQIFDFLKISDLVENFRIMIDDISQLKMLTDYNLKNKRSKKWSVYFKIDVGSHRAGKEIGTSGFNEILNALLIDDNDNKIKENISLFGFYTHAGHAYQSRSLNVAKYYLQQEIDAVNKAAAEAKKIDPKLILHLGVGATPTAHASSILDIVNFPELNGILEIHAGNYPFNDLQQVATGCVKMENIACGILADVISQYPNRGPKQPGEVLINAGVIALTREAGPMPGFGRVYTPLKYQDWIVGRISQEHGILTPLVGTKKTIMPRAGERLKILPQHSCISAASFPYIYVVDGSDEIVDIWIVWRGW